jgi:hypothetical protein
MNIDNINHKKYLLNFAYANRKAGKVEKLKICPIVPDKVALLFSKVTQRVIGSYALSCDRAQ